MDMKKDYDESLPLEGAFICSTIFSGITVLSTRSLNCAEERSIQAVAIILFFLWGFFWLFSVRRGKRRFDPVKTLVLIFITVGLLGFSSAIATNLIAGINEGMVGTDYMFHVSIAQAIKYHGIPSMLINSDCYFNYHFASHFIMAMLSNMLRIPVYFVYHYLYFVMMVPLYVYLILSVSQELKYKTIGRGELSFADLLTIYCFVTPVIISRHFSDDLLDWKSSWIVSESFLFSIVFTLIFVKLVLSLDRKGFLNGAVSKGVEWIAVPLFIVLISFSKISVGFFFVFAISYYKCRSTDFKNIREICLSAFYSIVFVLLFFVPGRFETVFRSNTSFSSLFPFHFIREYLLEKSDFGIHVILFFLFSLIFLFYRFREISLRELVNGRDYIFDEILLWICILGVIPGNLFEIMGGSAFYFCSVQQLIATILLIGYNVSEEIYHKISFKIKGFFLSRKIPINSLIIVVMACLIWNPLYSTYTIVKDTIEELQKGADNCRASIEEGSYWQIIMGIDRISGSDKKDYYVYVDKNADIWDHFLVHRGYDTASYFFPAFTGMVAIGELYYNDGELYYNNDEDYWSGWYKENPNEEKMLLSDAINKTKNDGKKGLFYIYDDTFRYIPTAE